jgi:hypothetical protein
MLPLISKYFYFGKIFVQLHIEASESRRKSMAYFLPMNKKTTHFCAMEQPESALLSITKHNGVKSFFEGTILFLILMFYEFS